MSARRLRCEAGTSLLLVARLLSAQSRAADLSRSSPRTLAVEHSSRYIDRIANERACQGAQGEREVRAGPEPTDSRERATAALNGLACPKRLLLSFHTSADKDSKGECTESGWSKRGRVRPSSSCSDCGPSLRPFPGLEGSERSAQTPSRTPRQQKKRICAHSQKRRCDRDLNPGATMAAANNRGKSQ